MITRLAAVVVLALVASGCSDGGVEVQTVRTTLFLDGSPVRAVADIVRGDGGEKTSHCSTA